MNNNLEQALASGIVEYDLFVSLINFIFCIGMGFLLKFLYVAYSYSLTGKHHIASILPILAGVVFIVITVVKSSLALSLGLVGALSIVRFRTPIKEPEELVYLFLAIAIGLGFGAGQTAITFVTVLILLGVIIIFLSNRKKNFGQDYNLIVQSASAPLEVDKVARIVSKYAETVRIVRTEQSSTSGLLVLNISLKNAPLQIDQLVTESRVLAEDVSVTFFQSPNA